ncbi:MAG: hypothetical protein GWO19_06165, partial [Nitrospinaceae bacterium]|nr:hypothetical protein [Nitrospinaceae bacterium]NIR54215.1 hypothetical protein [Nitrospinaceae bacterium]NIS84630.1 hypothetical protein [Nitrospinaceae bacterium]NIT81425.1 hypothetical protein [Nitrospinaceae bacterium]NIU95828.1 hypothetical protein [Nitrospinaceae bacterium]
MGDLDVIQAQGGIWGYMESNTALRDRSVMGLQIDSKMRRAIVLFKRECDEGNPPKPEV